MRWPVSGSSGTARFCNGSITCWPAECQIRRLPTTSTSNRRSEPVGRPDRGIDDQIKREVGGVPPERPDVGSVEPVVVDTLQANDAFLAFVRDEDGQS